MAETNIGEFLQRKAGPLPYWAWGIAGVLVIGGTIWLSRTGALDALAGGQAGSAGGGGEGAGASEQPTTTPTEAFLASHQIAGVAEAPTTFSSLPLVGQQEGGTGGILSGGGGGTIPVVSVVPALHIPGAVNTGESIILSGGTSGLKASAAAAVTPVAGGAGLFRSLQPATTPIAGGAGLFHNIQPATTPIAGGVGLFRSLTPVVQAPATPVTPTPAPAPVPVPRIVSGATLFRALATYVPPTQTQVVQTTTPLTAGRIARQLG